MDTMSPKTRTIIAVSATAASILSALGAYALFVQSSIKAIFGAGETDTNLAASGVLLWAFSCALTVTTAIILWRWSRREHPKLFSFLLGVLTSFVALQVCILLVGMIPVSI